MTLAVVILAAGQSTRLKSKHAKVLHPVAGKPIVAYCLDAVRDLDDQPTLVVGYQADRVCATVGNRAQFVEQCEQRGTGHAVLQTRALLENRADVILALYADMPLLTPATLHALAEKHTAARATITMLSVISDDSMGFGRVVRDENHQVRAIVEEADASPEIRALTELNCGVYCFDARWLWDHLPKIQPSPKGEFYLTDLIAMAVAENARVETWTLEDVNEVVGINTRVHLARVEKIMRDRIRERLMLNGVTLVDPATTFIDADVEVGLDTTILPGTYLQGKTKIGEDCEIGPNAIIRDATIGDRCRVISSLIEGAVLEEGVSMGPFSRLRPGAYLARGVRLGNFAEVKNSRLGENTLMGHFSYVGDAEVGARVNIGAGAITCNFDGQKKHRTIISDDAFIGSDTMLVAPVRIGARAKTGAGSVVTKDVPDDTLAVGAPARAIRKLSGAPKSESRG